MYTPSKKFGMVKSNDYRKWLEKNIPLIKNGLDKPDKFPISIEIVIFDGKGFSTKSDIDNVNKALVDALVKAEIIPDDNIRYITDCQERFVSSWTRHSEAMTVLTYYELE